ncbi:MAG: ArsR family transcriptional regulator [Propionibacteriales bacterium]|nr:ArsR family transcriptional regulator [Propionibacteriales bacterium]
MEPEPDIATVAAHFADRSRARMLLELIDGSARPASHLAQMAGVAAPTASGHLARLQQAHLITVEVDGRHRRYRIADDRVIVVLEALIPLATTSSPEGLRAHFRWQRLRVARSCYDHLAGSLGTDVMAGLLECEALTRTDQVAGPARAANDQLSAAVSHAPYRLGPSAVETFTPLGIDLDQLSQARRPLLRVCTDWTEQRHHLGGALGAAVLSALVERDWVRRRPQRRDLQVTEPARIAAWLGQANDAPPDEHL